MKSILFRRFLFFLIFFVPIQLLSQIDQEGFGQIGVKVIDHPLHSKGLMVGSDYIRKVGFQSYVVTQDESFSLNLEVKVNSIQSIIIYLQSKEYLLWNNRPEDSLILFDNGQNGDLKANDNIFTVSNLKNGSYYSFQNIGGAIIYMNVKYLFSNGSTFKENLSVYPGIRFINLNTVDIPAVYKINDTIQYSSNVINFVLDFNWDKMLTDYWHEYNRIEEIAIKAYYKYFPDDRDFFSVCSTFPNPSDGPAGSYGGVRNNVLGTDWQCPNSSCIFDYSNNYGSNGRLLGIINELQINGGNAFLIDHEMCHQWAVFLNPNLNLTDGTGHWGAVEFSSSVLTGQALNHFYQVNDTIYRGYSDSFTNIRQYNTLELYLMGMLPLDSVKFPIKALVNYKYLNTIFDASISPNFPIIEFSADGFSYIDKSKYLEYMLPRIPDYSKTQKDFNLSLIVLSDRLLSPKEMAYYNFLMMENEKKSDEKPTEEMGLNFYRATGGRGSLTTKLPQLINQDIWYTTYPLPTDPINLFISQDSTPQALAYNALSTKSERDAILGTKIKNDITAQVAYQGWNFNKSIPLLVHNSHDWGKGIYKDEKPLYGEYDGDNIDSIRFNGGTTKYVGALGIPSYDVYMPDVINRLNIVVTGDKLKDGSSFNCNKVPGNDFSSDTNLKPGQITIFGSMTDINIPSNTNEFMIYYSYLYKTETHDKNLARIPLVLFKIIAGKYEFVASNPHIKLIMERESDPPIINVKTKTNSDSLIWNIVDANFKSAFYSMNGSTKIPIGQSGGIKLGLSEGINTIIIGAEDYFKLSSKKTVQIIIDSTPPVINILSPVEGKIYDTDIQLKYKITSIDFKSASYTINGKLNMPARQSDTIPLLLPNGFYKVVLEAKDALLTIKDSVSFEMKKPVGIESLSIEDKVIIYPNPTNESVYIDLGDISVEKLITEIYSADGTLENHHTFQREGEKRVGIERLSKGIYFFKITLFCPGGESKTITKKFVKN